MDPRPIIASQYAASLTMLEDAVRSCPESLWLSDAFPNRYWLVAYHALYFTHLYLQDSLAAAVRWPKARENYHRLGKIPAADLAPYTKDEILEYLAVCRGAVDRRVPALDFAAPSGFEWLPFDKLELQFYNIRHLQHHTGQLADRLRSICSTGLRWARYGPDGRAL